VSETRSQDDPATPAGDEGGGKTADAGETARRAGRGGLAIAGAKLFFMVMGLVQQIALKHILGLGNYGALGRVQSIASVVYNPIIATSVQGVSRAVSGAQEADQPAAQRRVLTIHSLAILPVAVGFLLAAPYLAEAIRAPHLTNALRIVAGVLFFYGLYTPLVGVINGRKQFGWQAGLDALAATLRTAGLLGGAYYFMRLGQGVEGALAGFVCAAALMAGIALPLAGLGKGGSGGPTVGEHIKFIVPLVLGQLALNLLFQSDLTLLGRFAADAAAATPGLDEKAADTLAGAYRAAQLFCFLPYQLLLAITFVLFPLLATAHRDGDGDAVVRYVRTGVRLALLLAGLIVSVSAGLSRPLINLVFGPDAAALGGRAMFIMALGLGAFAIFGILVTVLTSLKHEVMSMVLTIVALALVVGLCFGLVRGQPFGEGMLIRTAIATGTGLVAATLLAVGAVKKTAGAVVSPITLLRVALGLTAAIAVGRYLPEPGKLMTLVYAAAVSAVYLVVLLISREITGADGQNLARVLGRKSS
jgi:stage V sporulation protein B